MKPPPVLQDLTGLPLWSVGRAANMLWLHFGERRQIASSVPSQTGTFREVGDFALHLTAPWRLSVAGRIFAGSQDLQFPFGVSSSAQVPADFDWDTSPSRLDQLVEHLGEQCLPAKVLSVTAGSAETFSLVLEREIELTVLPDCSSEAEHWRLFAPGDPEREHLISESLSGGVWPEGLQASPPRTIYTSAHASVRFMGHELDPLEVTHLLRLPYDHAHRQGEPRIVRRRSDRSVREYAPYRNGMWSMSSEGWVRSSDLNAHIRWVLEQLEPHQDQIQKLIASGVDADIYCYSYGLVEEPPTLPEETTARAKALGLVIEIAHYGASDD